MTVKYAHYRRIQGSPYLYLRRHQWKADGLQPDPRGGITTATITLEDGQTFTSSAICSDKDNYSKSIGRQIAFGRALKRAQREKQGMPLRAA